jgi:LmbE family N-acetylglucosaminyl deacetylase
MCDEPTLARTLIVAPHPDDDVIAAGGLIQRALDSGGDVRIAVVTDGESNPWPQRYMHRKWFITNGDRAQWGAMRRREALDALLRLGVREEATTFLAFADQQVAQLARRKDDALLVALKTSIDEFRPTLIVSPSAFDLHADHRAIAWYVHRAAGDETPITTYVIHGETPDSRCAVRIELTERERRRKRAAIECHQSQLLLSRERFLSYARPVEAFYSAEHDVVRVESWTAETLGALRHSMRVLFKPYRDPDASGVQPAADVHDGAGDVAGLL